MQGFDQLTSSNITGPERQTFNQNVDTIYKDAGRSIEIKSESGIIKVERKDLPGIYSIIFFI